MALHWWEEAEARALRTRGAAALALSIWQKLKECGMDAGLSLLPAHALAQAYMLGCDLVQMVDNLLVAPAGTLRLHLAELLHWCQRAHWELERSARPFLLLLDSLRLDPSEWSGSDAGGGSAAGTEGPEVWAESPAAQAKQDGRYRYWHLLYERLDLKLEAEGLPAAVRLPLSREVAEVYEEWLVLIRDLSRLLGETPARWGRWVRFLVDFDTTFHYHLGPRRLAAGRLTGGAVEVGLQYRLLAALASGTP